MRLPQVYMVAGPNGAGKSSHSEMFVKPGTIHFDGDKIATQYEIQYPGLDYGAIDDAVSNHFNALVGKAIAGKKDFTFETNFRDSNIMNVINEFKSEGYETNLIHIALPSVDESFRRVSLRKNLGGHSVDANSIRLNFQDGTINLIKYAGHFDRSIIYDNSLHQNAIAPLILIQRGAVLQTRDPMPEYHKPLIAEIVNNLPPKPEQTKKAGLGL